MCAAGPPNAVTPSRRNKVASSPSAARLVTRESYTRGRRPGWLRVGHAVTIGQRPRGLDDARRGRREGVQLFWLAVGGPTLGRAWGAGFTVAGGFLIAMYGSLVGSKALVAWAVGAGRSVFNHRAYVVLLRGLGVALGAYAAFYLLDALDYFRVI